MAIRRDSRSRELFGSTKQRQLIGILILLLTFVALFYAIMVMVQEGIISLSFGQAQTPPANAPKSTTTVMVVYNNVSNTG